MNGMWYNPQHVLPEDDLFDHFAAITCPCKPQIQNKYIPGIGGAAWYQHNTMIPTNELESVPPGWLLTDNDPED